MKEWKVLMGVQWQENTDRKKVGTFTTRSKGLSMEKWIHLGKGRSKIIRDDKARIWGLSCKQAMQGDIFVIHIELSKW